jgi:hypothetical protein
LKSSWTPHYSLRPQRSCSNDRFLRKHFREYEEDLCSDSERAGRRRLKFSVAAGFIAIALSFGGFFRGEEFPNPLLLFVGTGTNLEGTAVH